MSQKPLDAQRKVSIEVPNAGIYSRGIVDNIGFFNEVVRDANVVTQQKYAMLSGESNSAIQAFRDAENTAEKSLFGMNVDTASEDWRRVYSFFSEEDREYHKGTSMLESKIQPMILFGIMAGSALAGASAVMLVSGLAHWLSCATLFIFSSALITPSLMKLSEDG